MNEIKVGDICRTNLSQPGGLVKVLAIEGHWMDGSRMCACIEHIEDHPYGYKQGDSGGYYMIEDLEKVTEEQIIMWNIIKKYLREFEQENNIKLGDKSWQHFKAMEREILESMRPEPLRLTKFQTEDGETVYVENPDWVAWRDRQK